MDALKVKELIAKLQETDQDLEVWVQADEVDGSEAPVFDLTPRMTLDYGGEPHRVCMLLRESA